MQDGLKLTYARENILKWDMAETAKGGPFQEILDGESTLPRLVNNSADPICSRHFCQLHLPISTNSQIYHVRLYRSSW